MKREECGLLVVDVQERLFAVIDRANEVARKMRMAIEAARILELPIVVSEQYPQGLGRTIPYLREVLPDDQVYREKRRFSAYTPDLDGRTWLVVGIETHVCVLQTAKELGSAVVLSDAVSSRSVLDFSSALQELVHAGVRVSTLETVLFELLDDSRDPKFKAISELVK